MSNFSAYLVAVVALFARPMALVAQESPYADMTHRDIKALSEDQVTGYLEGQGMGLALAAELNGYPGPRHVLDLAAQLELSGQQRERTQEAFETMRQAATALGRDIVARERALDSLFRSAEITETQLEGMLTSLGGLQARLRYTHLAAHLRMREILSEHQVMRYRKLRGYLGEEAHGDHGRHSR